MSRTILLGCLLATLLSLAPAAVASPTLTVKQAKTETRKDARLQAKSFAGYPDRVSYKTGACKRSSQRRIICGFTVDKKLDNGKTLSCPFEADVRMRSGKPYTAGIAAHDDECKTS